MPKIWMLRMAHDWFVSPLEEENSQKLKQIENAIKIGRSIIVIGQSDMEPLVIDFTRNTKERKRKLGKIGVCVIENSKSKM